jgi:hypothetical protein
MFIITNDNPTWLTVLLFLAEWLPMQLFSMVRRCMCMKEDEIKEEEELEEKQSEDGSEASAGADARAERLRKRLYASAGFLGIYVVWTIFSWCVHACGMPPLFAVSLPDGPSVVPHADAACLPVRPALNAANTVCTSHAFVFRSPPAFLLLRYRRCRFIFTCALHARHAGGLALY